MNLTQADYKAIADLIGISVEKLLSLEPEQMDEIIAAKRGKSVEFPTTFKEEPPRGNVFVAAGRIITRSKIEEAFRRLFP